MVPWALCSTNANLQISHVRQRSFDENVLSEVIQGNDFEAQFGHDAAQKLNLTKYDALNRAFDIESFHTFVDYLLQRGPGGDHNGEVWSIRQKHWRNASK